MQRRELLRAGAAAIGAAEAMRRFGHENIVNAQATFTRENAAANYGLEPYPQNPNNWTTTLFNEGRTISSELIPNTNGEHYRVRTAGAQSVEAHVTIAQRPGDTTTFSRGNGRALVLAVDPNAVPLLDISGGTLWHGEGVSPQLTFNQLKAKELIEQPGVVVVPVGFSPECPPLDPVPFIDTPEGAAFWYGGDDWSQFPGNWEVTKFDNGRVVSLALKGRPGGHHTRLREQEGLRGLYGIALEGWIGINRPDGSRDALAFVGDGTVFSHGIDVREATLWNDFTPGYPQIRQIVIPRLWEQVSARERIEQPDVLVLPFGFKPGGVVCQVDP